MIFISAAPEWFDEFFSQNCVKVVAAADAYADEHFLERGSQGKFPE